LLRSLKAGTIWQREPKSDQKQKNLTKQKKVFFFSSKNAPAQNFKTNRNAKN